MVRRLLCVALLISSAGGSVFGETGHERMLRLLKELQSRVADDHFYLSDTAAREMRSGFENLREDAPAVIRWEAHFRLGQQEQHVGNERKAIEHFESALRILPEIENEIASDWVGRLYFGLGMAYLRHGETQNCALRHAAESCILPIRGSGVHVDREPSRKAAEQFLELIKIAPPGSEPYLTGIWLLNVAHMTIDSYPEGVPEAYRIDPSRFDSDASFPLFPNVAIPTGVATFSLSGGVVVEDFDENGWLDLLVSSYDPFESLRLFLNVDGLYRDVSSAAGLDGLYGGLNMVQGDYDDDGDADVLVLRGAWLGKGGKQPNSLLRNNGDGTFTDVTFDVGLGEEHWPTQTASWGDFDNDGDLDLYVGNETNEELHAPSQLFENRGDATFRDVAVGAGVVNERFSKGVVFGDYDGDRFPDLYVSNLDGDNRLYRNGRDGTFEDVAPSLGLTRPRRSFPTWFWDYDNDGQLDLFVSAYEALVKHTTLFLQEGRYDGEKARIYRGVGNGSFEEEGQRLGLDEPSAPMGANFGDLDLDGYPDFYLGTGYPPYYALMPNVMYWNRSGEGFADVTTAGGFGHLQKGHAVAFLDFDNDGDQDVFEQMGGALAGDKFNDVLYENPGFGNRSLSLRLSGVASNRAAIGARIRVDVVEEGRARTVYKYVNSGGSFGANSVLRQTIGLGGAERIERLEIYWPMSDRTQTFTEVPIDSYFHVKESVDSLMALPY